MKTKQLKTEAWPNGRSWPDEIVLDVGSNMPHDIYGVGDSNYGVRYVRHDISKKKELDAYKAGMTEAAEMLVKESQYKLTPDSLKTLWSKRILTARDNKTNS